jgi:hypothetical protein
VEKKNTLARTGDALEAERENFFGTGTEAQNQIARAVDARITANAGGELTEAQRNDLAAIKSKGESLEAAVEQGVMKKHTFSRRMEAMLRDAKRERPDLAQELDKMYAEKLGFDVRGAAMDYYNYTLQQYADLQKTEAAKQGASQQAVNAKASVVKEMVKGLPEADRVEAERELRNAEMLYLNTGDAGSYDQVLNRFHQGLGNVESETRARAMVDANNLLTEITTNAVKLNQALQGKTGLDLNGELSEEQRSSISTLIVRVDANISALAGVGGKEAEARIKLLTAEREELVKAQQTNTLGAVIDYGKRTAEYAEMNLDPNQRARILDAAKVMNVPEPERGKFLRDIAPAIKAGEAMNQKFVRGEATPWTVTYPTGMSDQISGAFVKKTLDRLGTVDKQDEIANVLPVAVESLYAYGAQRVDQQGRVKVRLPNEIFGSGGSLSVVGTESFAESPAAKRLKALPEFERRQLAYALAMQLDRYNESIAASVSSANTDVPNLPVRSTQVLDKMLGGEVAMTVGYQPVHSTMYKTGKVEELDVYKDSALRTWNFIKDLSK